MYTTIKKGKHYAIHTFSGNDSCELRFNHRDADGKIVDGVTREDIYRVMLDMIRADDERNPKHENKIQLRHLEAALESQRVAIRTKIKHEKGNIG